MGTIPDYILLGKRNGRREAAEKNLDSLPGGMVLTCRK
jgi:hypothetical protein